MLRRSPQLAAPRISRNSWPQRLHPGTADLDHFHFSRRAHRSNRLPIDVDLCGARSANVKHGAVLEIDLDRVILMQYLGELRFRVRTD